MQHVVCWLYIYITVLHTANPIEEVAVEVDQCQAESRSPKSEETPTIQFGHDVTTMMHDEEWGCDLRL